MKRLTNGSRIEKQFFVFELKIVCKGCLININQIDTQMFKSILVALTVLCLVFVLSAPQVAVVNNESNDLACTGCKMVIRVLENWVTQNTTVTEITNLISKICPYLDPTVREVVRAPIYSTNF